MTRLFDFKKAVLFCAFIAAGTQAQAEITTSLVNANLTSGGLIGGKFSTSETTLVLAKDGEEFARLPVRVRGNLFGLIGGVANTKGATFRLSGLSETTKVSDIFTKYKGFSRGGAFVLPGPFVGGGKTITAKNAAKTIDLYFHLDSGAGVELDLSRATVYLSPSESTLRRGELSYDTTLADLIRRRQKFALSMKNMATIKCNVSGMADDIQLIYVEINNTTTLKSSITIRTDHAIQVGAFNAKPTFESNHLILRGVGRSETASLDIDLTTEKKNPFFQGLNLDPRGMKFGGTTIVNYAITRDGSRFTGTQTCEVFSTDNLRSAAEAALISLEYLDL